MSSLLQPKRAQSGKMASPAPAPVLLLARSGDVEELKQFLANSDDDCIRGVDKHGQSLLHLAVEEGHTDMCLYLIEKKKLDVNFRDRNGWTPLHVACSKGDCRLVAVLLATNSCDVTLKTVEGATVLHYFVRKEPQKGRVWGQDSYFVLIKKIVDSGCNPDAQNVNGETAIHAAASAGKTSVVVYLSRLNVDLNTVNKYGETCLHLAARRGDAEMVTCLLSLGVDANVEGDNGTALQVAEKAGFENVCKILTETAPMSLSNQGDNISHALERARETGKLDLSNLGLPGIPPEIFELTNLVELDLSHNSIATVPPAICQLTALKSLRLEDNRLSQLPREMGEMGWLEELTLSLNSDLDPGLKRKMREGVPALLDHLRSASGGFKTTRASMLSMSKRGSVGEQSLDLKPETPAEERLIRALEERERTLAKKERKLNETIALIQEKNESTRVMLAEIKEREEAVEARERGLRAAGGERTRTHSADPPRPRKQLPLVRSDNTLGLDSASEPPPTFVKTTKIGKVNGVKVSLSSTLSGVDVELHLATRQHSLTLTLEQWHGVVKLMASRDRSNSHRASEESSQTIEEIECPLYNS